MTNHRPDWQTSKFESCSGLMKTRHEIGRIDGKQYKLAYDQRKNQHAVDHKYRNEWRWFLTVDGDYQGDFRTRTEALLHCEQL